MPAEVDSTESEWTGGGFSNVVYVRTKSLNEPSSKEETIYHVKCNIEEPHVHSLRTDYAPPPSPTWRQYEGINKININLQHPEIHHIPVTSQVISSRRPPVPRTRRRPVTHHFIPEPVISADFHISRLPSFANDSWLPPRPSTFTTVTSSLPGRSSSLPPPLESSSYSRRTSISVPRTSGYDWRLPETKVVSWTEPRDYEIYSSPTVGSASFKNQTNLSRLPPLAASSTFQSVSGRSTGLPSLDVLSSRHRASYSGPSTISFPAGSTHTRRTRLHTDVIDDDDDDSHGRTPDSLASLRARTKVAKDKVDLQRTMLDRYLPGDGDISASNLRSQMERKMSQFTTNRVSDHEMHCPNIRRYSVSNARSLLSRAGSQERIMDPSRSFRTPPPTPPLSEARRKIRDVLFKVSGDAEYLH